MTISVQHALANPFQLPGQTIYYHKTFARIQNCNSQPQVIQEYQFFVDDDCNQQMMHPSNFTVHNRLHVRMNTIYTLIGNAIYTIDLLTFKKIAEMLDFRKKNCGDYLIGVFNNSLITTSSSSIYLLHEQTLTELKLRISGENIKYFQCSNINYFHNKCILQVTMKDVQYILVVNSIVMQTLDCSILFTGHIIEQAFSPLGLSIFKIAESCYIIIDLTKMYLKYFQSKVLDITQLQTTPLGLQYPSEVMNQISSNDYSQIIDGEINLLKQQNKYLIRDEKQFNENINSNIAIFRSIYASVDKIRFSHEETQKQLKAQSQKYDQLEQKFTNLNKNIEKIEYNLNFLVGNLQNQQGAMLKRMEGMMQKYIESQLQEKFTQAQWQQKIEQQLKNDKVGSKLENAAQDTITNQLKPKSTTKLLGNEQTEIWLQDWKVLNIQIGNDNKELQQLFQILLNNYQQLIPVLCISQNEIKLMSSWFLAQKHDLLCITMKNIGDMWKHIKREDWKSSQFLLKTYENLKELLDHLNDILFTGEMDSIRQNYKKINEYDKSKQYGNNVVMIQLVCDWHQSVRQLQNNIQQVQEIEANHIEDNTQKFLKTISAELHIYQFTSFCFEQLHDNKSVKINNDNKDKSSQSVFSQTISDQQHAIQLIEIQEEPQIKQQEQQKIQFNFGSLQQSVDLKLQNQKIEQDQAAKSTEISQFKFNLNQSVEAQNKVLVEHNAVQDQNKPQEIISQQQIENQNKNQTATTDVQNQEQNTQKLIQSVGGGEQQVQKEENKLKADKQLTPLNGKNNQQSSTNQQQQTVLDAKNWHFQFKTDAQQQNHQNVSQSSNIVKDANNLAILPQQKESNVLDSQSNAQQTQQQSEQKNQTKQQINDMQLQQQWSDVTSNHAEFQQVQKQQVADLKKVEAEQKTEQQTKLQNIFGAPQNFGSTQKLFTFGSQQQKAQQVQNKGFFGQIAKQKTDNKADNQQAANAAVASQQQQPLVDNNQYVNTQNNDKTKPQQITNADHHAKSDILRDEVEPKYEEQQQILIEELQRSEYLQNNNQQQMNNQNPQTQIQIIQAQSHGKTQQNNEIVQNAQSQCNTKGFALVNNDNIQLFTKQTDNWLHNFETMKEAISDGSEQIEQVLQSLLQNYKQLSPFLYISQSELSKLPTDSHEQMHNLVCIMLKIADGLWKHIKFDDSKSKQFLLNTNALLKQMLNRLNDVLFQIEINSIKKCFNQLSEYDQKQNDESSLLMMQTNAQQLRQCILQLQKRIQKIMVVEDDHRELQTGQYLITILAELQQYQQYVFCFESKVIDTPQCNKQQENGQQQNSILNSIPQQPQMTIQQVKDQQQLKQVLQSQLLDSKEKKNDHIVYISDTKEEINTQLSEQQRKKLQNIFGVPQNFGFSTGNTEKLNIFGNQQSQAQQVQNKGFFAQSDANLIIDKKPDDKQKNDNPAISKQPANLNTNQQLIQTNNTISQDSESNTNKAHQLATTDTQSIQTIEQDINKNSIKPIPQDNQAVMNQNEQTALQKQKQNPPENESEKQPTTYPQQDQNLNCVKGFALLSNDNVQLFKKPHEDDGEE